MNFKIYFMQLENIQQKIFEIRENRVMLDFDLALLYGVETRALKQAVKRNPERFPADFMFQLTKTEWRELITNCDKLPESVKYSPSLPFAFSEQGVAMISSVLKSKKAVLANIAIMRTFIELRRFSILNEEIIDQLKEFREKIGEHDVQLSQIYDAIENLLDDKTKQTNWDNRERIGYK